MGWPTVQSKLVPDCKAQVSKPQEMGLRSQLMPNHSLSYVITYENYVITTLGSLGLTKKFRPFLRTGRSW